MFCTVKGISGIRMTWAPPGNALVQRDPAGVAAHDFDHHHAVMRLGRGVNLVVGSRGDGGVEAEGDVGGRQIVVDVLGTATILVPWWKSSGAIFCEPSPPTVMIASIPSFRVGDDLVGNVADDFLARSPSSCIDRDCHG